MRKQRSPVRADLEREVAEILAAEPGERRRRPGDRRVAYDRAADEAARATAETRSPNAGPAVHRRAARANFAAAEIARELRDDDAATGHERLANAHQETALRQESEAPPSDPEIARAVREAIRRVDAAGRFGPHKVFVSAVWATLSRDPRFRRWSLGEFKRSLLRLHQDGLVDLARADLVGAMDPRQVGASEIVGPGRVSFHFVLDPAHLP
jgi:hypothetical protein